MSETELRQRISDLVDAISNAHSTKEVQELSAELEKRIADLKALEQQPALALH